MPDLALDLRFLRSQVPQSTVSRRVQLLEHRLGARQREGSRADALAISGLLRLVKVIGSMHVFEQVLDAHRVYVGWEGARRPSGTRGMQPMSIPSCDGKPSIRRRSTRT